jgi:hypothetical protein
MRIDPANGALVPKFDVAPAERFGEIVWLLPPSAAPWGTTVVAELRDKLVDYDGDRDFLVLIGNPCLIGMTVALAAAAGGGKLQFLQWSGKGGSHYVPIRQQGIRYAT